MEWFSGVLLTCVVLGIVAVLLREVVGDRAVSAVRKYLAGSAADVRDPLIGRGGTVVESAGETMRVRIEGERWSANRSRGAVFPAGTRVRVTAVNGWVLDVEEDSGEGDAEAGG